MPPSYPPQSQPPVPPAKKRGKKKRKPMSPAQTALVQQFMNKQKSK